MTALIQLHEEHTSLRCESGARSKPPLISRRVAKLLRDANLCIERTCFRYKRALCAWSSIIIIYRRRCCCCCRCIIDIIPTVLQLLDAVFGCVYVCKLVCECIHEAVTQPSAHSYTKTKYTYTHTYRRTDSIESPPMIRTIFVVGRKCFDGLRSADSFVSRTTLVSRLAPAQVCNERDTSMTKAPNSI